MISGVISGSLVKRFGCQKVLFAGSVITAGALVAFAFAPNLEVLCVLNCIAGKYKQSMLLNLCIAV